MSSIGVGIRRAVVLAGVVGVLAIVACGKEPKRGVKNVQPTQVEEEVETPATPTAKPVLPAEPEEDPEAAKPSPPPGGLAVKPTTPGEFVPPSSPTFTPPESLPGAQLPGSPPVSPPAAPPAAPPMTTTPQPEPPKPVELPTTPEPPKTPPKEEYPSHIGGRDLEMWLKELRYNAGNPAQKDDQIREAAVKAIPGFGPSARKPSVKPLIEVIRSDPDPGVQVAAITVVSNMGFDLREEVKPVIQVLQNKLKLAPSGNIVRMYCVRSLASFGSDAASSIPYFREVCLDPSWETRREIAIALSLVGGSPPDKDGKPKEKAEPDERAIEVLMEYQLQDRSVAVRLEAAKSLLALGPPKLKDFVKGTEKHQDTIKKVVLFESGKGPKTNHRGAGPDRGQYVWALLLQIMYDDRTIPANIKEIARLVKEPEGPTADVVRLYALQALGAAGPLFPGLVQLDKLADEKVAPKAIGAVIDALQYTHEPLLIYTAMNTLALIGNEARDAVPALEKIAADKPKPPPEGSPKGTPPDDSLQRMAKQTIEVIVGKRKFDDYGKEDPKK